MSKGWFLDDILYVKKGGVLKPQNHVYNAECNHCIIETNLRLTESPKVYGPSKEYLDFVNAPKEKHENVIEVDFKGKKRK